MIVCNDSKEIERIKDELGDFTHQLRKITKKIENDVAALHVHTLHQEFNLRQQNPYIVKSVIKYMANGLNKTDAMLLTARDYDTDIKRISAVLWGQNRYMSAINLFAKRYACEKLKNAGFTAKQIAKIVGVSENHVFKLLRSTVDFWFLE